MKRKHKRYSKPKRPFEKERILEEEQIKKDFGLKNKKEIWKADAEVKRMREKAKKLISASPNDQKALFDRLRKIGLDVNSISDVLSLDKSDYLNRRLQTVLVNKKLAPSPRSSRQLITHKKVLIDNRVVSSPSYIVPVELEDKIVLKHKKKKEKPKGEIKEEKPVEETPAKEKSDEPIEQEKPEEKQNE